MIAFVDGLQRELSMIRPSCGRRRTSTCCATPAESGRGVVAMRGMSCRPPTGDSLHNCSGSPIRRPTHRCSVGTSGGAPVGLPRFGRHRCLPPRHCASRDVHRAYATAAGGACPGGRWIGALTVAFTDIVVMGKVINMATVMLAVFLMSALVLQSFVGGALVVLPLCMTVLVEFALMAVPASPSTRARRRSPRWRSASGPTMPSISSTACATSTPMWARGAGLARDARHLRPGGDHRGLRDLGGIREPAVVGLRAVSHHGAARDHHDDGELPERVGHDGPCRGATPSLPLRNSRPGSP